ncbi:hypothetical protein [Paenibacillus tianmuensis]|uniref:hypothetical protein n=1 Tax=Paenibacillus tianmuensis TaxID=624147 RepID=UPI00142F83EB|nr:hypothetical protein [Paenibacillus tianmuensis]
MVNQQAWANLFDLDVQVKDININTSTHQGVGYTADSNCEREVNTQTCFFCTMIC